jgi:hypothetical protein
VRERERYTFKHDVTRVGRGLNCKEAVTTKAWCALPRDFRAGEAIYRYRGHTYGLDRDDMVYGGVETIPCTLEPSGDTFFTVPVEFLVDKDGNEPSGDYISLDKIRKAAQQ